MQHPGKPRGRVDPRDGPVARIGTLEWQAWHDYYKSQGRWFSCKTMEDYKRHGTDWPVTSTWPPNITPAMKDRANAR